jgi:hypothetical protein
VKREGIGHMHTGFSVGEPSGRVKRPNATKAQRHSAERENQRKRIQNQIKCWGEARAKDERSHQVIVRKVAPSDPNGHRRETYRAMHAQCDRVWAERIQVKRAELAALTNASSPR